MFATPSFTTRITANSSESASSNSGLMRTGTIPIAHLMYVDFSPDLVNCSPSAHYIGAVRQVPEEKLVLGEPLHRLEQIGGQRQGVSGGLLTTVQQRHGRSFSSKVL